MSFSTSILKAQTTRGASSRNLVVANSAKRDARCQMLAVLASAPLILAPVAMADIAEIEADLSPPGIEYASEVAANEEKSSQTELIEPDTKGATESALKKALDTEFAGVDSKETKDFVKSAWKFFSGDLSELPEDVVSAPAVVVEVSSTPAMTDIQKIESELSAPDITYEAEVLANEEKSSQTAFIEPDTKGAIESAQEKALGSEFTGVTSANTGSFLDSAKRFFSGKF